MGMKVTIQEVIKKVHDIDHAILYVEDILANEYLSDRDSSCDLSDVVNLLAEYRDKILDSKVDI
jgi:hypothetical protein